MWPGDRHAGGLGAAPQAAGGRMAVHLCAAVAEQDRPAGTGIDRPVKGPPGGWRGRDQDGLAAFAAHTQHPVVMSFAEIGRLRAGGLEDPQAERMAGRVYARLDLLGSAD
jgi:hypothetical protein